ncbi:MAG TPA: Uma2 family endonuclease [Polyangia bacterium]|jgi:Uma2 family endonuclease|nr:Uma2 family endonuclease [Polyangia bacterium]
MLARRFTEHDDQPVEDKIVLLKGATWADYQRHLEMRGDKASPRLAYLEGVLEIVTPSLPHQSIKSVMGRLVEVWCLEKGVEFNPCGSWTLENKERQRGVEPDECYVFGELTNATRPDLAIEVVWTSGGLAKLDIYRKLAVREVWFWRRGRLTVHVLRDEAYQEIPRSEVLPGIDLDVLVTFLDRPTASRAIRDYRASLQSGG